ncbi:MAG: tetratricopeptide repeat protein [Flavobacteriales bacterium]
MKKLLLFLLTGILSPSFSQSYQKQFSGLFSKKDTAGQRMLLQKWEAADSNDAELYVSLFNYYVNKSRTNMLTIEKRPKSKESFAITDSTSKTVGFINDGVWYDPTVDLGFAAIEKGISKFPERLDMRFGKTYVYGEIKDYEGFTMEIIKAIEYGQTINNKWTWSQGKPLSDARNFMLGNIQKYVFQMYNTGDDSLLKYMKQISETVLKYYPDHVESLSNMSIVCLLNKQYDEALGYLLKAEKITPHDYIVLGNIAQAYKLKGDKKKALKYYKLVLKHGDEQGKKYAEEQIKELE